MALRELKRGELTLKDMSTLREDRSAREQEKIPSGSLRDYSINHDIKMYWGFKEETRDLLPFRLTIDGQPFMLSWAELRDADREGFFRREVGNPLSYTPRIYSPGLTFSVDVNEEAQRDRIILLTGPNIEAYIDWYQVLRLGRFI